MGAHSPLAHLIPSSAHAAHTRGHALGAPRQYDAFVNLFFLGRRRSSFETLVRAADVKPAQAVLDVGCGTGYFACMLARVVGADGLVVGVDASAEMIGYATERATAQNCHFQLGTAESLGFPDARFDVVVSSLFMHHLPEDLRLTALKEMWRVLRPGGTLLIAEAYVPGAFGWRLLAHLHGYDRMAQAVPALERTIGEADFDQVQSGVAPPWLRYVRATRP